MPITIFVFVFSNLVVVIVFVIDGDILSWVNFGISKDWSLYPTRHPGMPYALEKEYMLMTPSLAVGDV
jgi:hypothetical protein